MNGLALGEHCSHTRSNSRSAAWCPSAINSAGRS